MIAVIKYNSGNIQSVAFALDRIGASYEVTGNPERIVKADHVIFPGVGEAGATMNYLRETKLDKVIKDLRQPVLGICLGMQLMCRSSEESNTECLGIFDHPVLKFKADQNHKVPHMGWNQIDLKTDWLDGALQGKDVYFVHSYYVPVNENTSAITTYTLPFSAAMRKNNYYAVQFHPEKSANAGESVLKSFLSL